MVSLGRCKDARLASLLFQVRDAQFGVAQEAAVALLTACVRTDTQVKCGWVRVPASSVLTMHALA